MIENLELKLMITAVAAIVVGVYVYAWVCIYRAIVAYIAKSNFSKQYEIGKLPKSIKVKRKKDKVEHNYFQLAFPVWYKSKKDGTADLRVKKNPILWQKSELYVEHYIVFSMRPYDLLGVVSKLRSQKVKIDLCREENIKRKELIREKIAFTHDGDIQKVIDYYSDCPTDFEVLCADMYESLGYETKLTPPTNDGGYDILLIWEEERTIVECKCYAIENKIGRPAIQKLVGANSTVSADKMIFITTSDFSPQAVEYAENVGVELINGYELMNLLNEQGFFEKGEVKVTAGECQLTARDLRRYIPTDIYEQYFI